MPSSSARCLNGYVMAVFYLHNIIFLFTIKIEDQHCCLALWNLVIFVLSPQLIRSDIGELGLSVEILKHIQRTWVISLLQIIFTKFSTARELILYQPSLQLKMSSYLKSIVGIMFFLKPSHDSTNKNILHRQSFKPFQHQKHISMWVHSSKSSLSAIITQLKVRFCAEKSKVLQ